MKFKSLKYKILFWFTGTISSVLVVFSFLLYSLLEDSIHGEIKLQMKNKAHFIQKNILNDLNKEKIKLYSELLNIEFLILKNKEIMYVSDNFPLELTGFYQEFTSNFFIYNTKKNTEDAVFRTSITTPYNGEIILYLEEINNKAEKVQEILIYLNPILLLFLIWLGNQLIDKILIPINRLTKTTENINISEMPKNIIIPKENNEMTQLISSFNDMIKRLRNGIETLNNFNHDVSHELKTPITVINTAIELSLRKERDSYYYKNSIHTIQYEIGQIEKIIDELFLFTKYSKGNIQGTFKESNLDSILLDAIHKYEKHAQDKNITINIGKIEHISLKINPILINIVFSNLIDNAIKYTPNNKQIYIKLTNENKKPIFSIQDEGIGIKSENLDKITEKFYRVDESRNKKIEGFGLGLSIVKNFVNFHNAILIIESKYNIGSKVQIKF